MCDMGKINKDLQAKANLSAAKATDPVEKLQARLLCRGASGIKGLSRSFRIMDDNRDQKLTLDEFITGFRDCGVRLSQADLEATFRVFDKDGSGTISVGEFLQKLSPKMNDRRKQLVKEAFASLDKTGDGIVTVADLAGSYNASKHPKFISGDMTENDVLKEYLQTFEAEGNIDGQVTIEEFMDYYASISCSIDSDAYFDLMMRNSWKLD